MRGVTLFLLLAGCATPVVEAERPIELEIVEQTPTEITVKVKKPPPAPKPPPEKPQDPPVVKLPPCQSVPGDKATALVQKFDCLIETADKPLPLKPKPKH